jgi:hypothetical protein
MPCQFAVDRYKGRLYVELRTEGGFTYGDLRPPLPFGCVEGVLETPVPPGTPVERIHGGHRPLSDEEIESLLSPGAECEQVAEGQQGFILD